MPPEGHASTDAGAAFSPKALFNAGAFGPLVT